MIKTKGGGRGGRRPGAGRPRGSRNKSYAEIAEEVRREYLAASPSPGMPIPTTLPLKTNGDSVIPALHRLVGDARAGLDRRLRRLEQTGQHQTGRIEEALATLDRVLKHQTAIARSVGAIEPTFMPRHTRRRPLGPDS